MYYLKYCYVLYANHVHKYIIPCTIYGFGAHVLLAL